MKKIAINIIGLILLLQSCATSMTPIQVNSTLPTLTESKFVSRSQLAGLIDANKCEYLAKGRSYVAPIGLTVKNDLKNGAQGIDEWVQLDGGNSYVLTNYEWIRVGDDGATELHLEFDTLLCR